MFEKYHGMSFRLRMVGAIQMTLHLLLLPVFIIRQLFTRTRPLPRLRYPDLMHLSATRLAEKIRNRELTSEQIVRAYIFRCRDVNPQLNAIVEERYEEAIREAHEVDQALLLGNKSREELESETPLLGVPITVKESIAVKGMSQAGGSLKRKGHKAVSDAAVITRLRTAGAIPLVVTNTPELCTGWESNNYLTGATKNPYDFARTAGGSSGGEAALIASAASVIGVGSDLAGSIRIPCLSTGIFGHKPTSGIVPVEGHYPLIEDDEFKKFLVIGPMTRYAEDLTLMMKVMAGPENVRQLDLDSPVSITNLKVYYKESMGKDALFVLGVDNEIKVAIKKAIHYFRSHCAFAEELNLREFLLTPEFCMATAFSIEDLPSIYSLIEPDFHTKSTPNTFVEILKTLVGLSAYTIQALNMQLYIEQCGFLSKPTETNKYKQLMKIFQHKFEKILGTDGVFIYPSSPTQALRHGEFVLTSSGAYYSMLANVMGLPATHVPLGLGANKVPVGLQVMAGPNQDRLCLAVARKLEEIFYGWTLPDSSGHLVEHRS